ncbi:MAG: hypothetical protein Q8P86_03360 [bacterium]|nr:hypothetical protein [bacterium]
MATDSQVRKYIIEARDYGMSDSQIRDELKKQAWSDSDINEAFQDTSHTSPMPPPEIKARESSYKSLNDYPNGSYQNSYHGSKEKVKPALNPWLPPTQETSAFQNADSEISPKSEVLSSSAPASPRKHGVMMSIIIAAIVMLTGGAAYAYVNNLWFFGGAPYKNSSEILTKGIAKFADMDTARYELAVSFYSMDREPNARPFTYDDSEVEARRPMFERDRQRMDVLEALNNLRFYPGDNKNRYPKTLDEYFNDSQTLSYNKNNKDVFFENKNLIDDSFVYIVDSDRQGYTLSVEFETDEAIWEIEKRLPYSISANTGPKSAQISGKTLTFDENQPYFYFYQFTGSPPAPPVVDFLQSRDRLFLSMPSELSLEGALSGAVNFEKQAENQSDIKPNTEFNVGVDAGFGDSSYMIDFDLRLVDEILYVRINKFPSLPFISAYFDPGLIKGKWVKISKDDVENTFLPLSDFGAYEQGEEEEASPDNMAIAFTEVMKIVNDEGLFFVKGNAKKEKVGGKTAYKYVLGMDREKILPVYTRVVKEISPKLYGQEGAEADWEPDPKVTAILESELFESFFNHMQENNEFAIWFTKDGFPAQVRYQTRMIPISDSARLKNKQYFLDSRYSFFDINQPLDIKAPQEFINIKELEELFANPLY